MNIARERYIKRLIARKHDGFVKVITGLRRCGKSYLLFNLFRAHLLGAGVDERHIICVDLDDKENVALRNPHHLFDFIVKRLSNDGKWGLLPKGHCRKGISQTHAGQRRRMASWGHSVFTG